jgi:hypothetical protein
LVGSQCRSVGAAGQPAEGLVPVHVLEARHPIALGVQEPPDLPDEPCTLWISEDGSLAPEAPRSAFACSRAQISHWLAGHVPLWLWARRDDGIAVLRDANLDPEMRRMVRELRDLLAPRHAGGLVALAITDDGPIRDVLAAMVPTHVPTFADLARGLAASPDPGAPRLARLAWALEHL